MHQTSLRFRLLAVLLFLALLAAGEIVALSCLEVAAEKFKPDQKLILVDHNLREVSGRLIAVDLAQDRISIYRIIDDVLADTSLAGNDLHVIKYRASQGKLKPLYMLLGAFGGAIITSAIVRASGKTCSGWDTSCAEISGVGALGGFLVGTIVPLLKTEEKTLECRQ